MTDYALTGKKGTGKSKHAVLLIRDRYLKHGRLVATNLDLDLKAMFGVTSRKTYVRVPDKPTSFDLLAIGHGNPNSYDEDLNGALVLDEMGTWLNTRTFNDKDRAAVLDYFAHARKHGFDSWYIMQNVVQVDKQLRESFIEQTVRHTAFAKVRIPFIGWILSALFGERAGFFPRFHTAVYRIGTGPQDLVTNRAVFTGKDVEACYDTRQVFRESYPHGTHTVLSPWHVEGRYLEPEKPGFFRALWLSLVKGERPAKPKPRAPRAPSPELARVRRLVASLPAPDQVRILSRFYRMHDAGAAVGAPAPALAGAGARAARP